MGSVGCWGGGRARQLLLSSVPEHPQTLRPGQQAGVPRPPPYPREQQPLPSRGEGCVAWLVGPEGQAR